MNEKVDEGALRAKLLSGARWSVTLRIVGQGYSWLVTLFMVRLLAPADYGLNAMLEAPLEIVGLFSTWWIDAALVRFGRKDPEQLASAFGFLLLANGLLFAGLLAGAPWIAGYFHQPELSALVRVSALAFVIAPFRIIPNVLLDMDLDFRLKSKVELAALLVSTLVGLGMAWAGAGVWALVAVTLVGAAFRAAAMSWLRPWFARPRLDPAQIRPLLAYGLHIMMATVIMMAASKVHTVLGGPVLGASVMGMFAVAAFFAHIPISKAMPVVQQTLMPAFAKLAGDTRLVRNYILNSLELCAVFILPVGIGVAVVAEDFVATFLGAQWAGAAMPLAVLALLTPLKLVNALMQAPLNATGHARLGMFMALAIFALYATLIHFVLDRGLMGLVWLFCGGAVVECTLALAAAHAAFGLGPLPLLGVMARPLLGCAAMAAAVTGANALTHGLPAPAGLGIGVAVGAAAYLGTLVLLMGRRLRELVGIVLGR